MNECITFVENLDQWRADHEAVEQQNSLRVLVSCYCVLNTLNDRLCAMSSYYISNDRQIVPVNFTVAFHQSPLCCEQSCNVGQWCGHQVIQVYRLEMIHLHDWFQSFIEIFFKMSLSLSQSPCGNNKIQLCQLKYRIHWSCGFFYSAGKPFQYSKRKVAFNSQLSLFIWFPLICLID